MKFLKRAFVFLLCLNLVFCFSACSKNENKEQDNGAYSDSLNPSITGKWSAKIDTSYFMKDYLEQVGMNELNDKPLYSYYYLELNENGTYSYAINNEETAKQIKEYLNSMLEPMLNNIYKAYEEQGISKKEADEQFKKATGKSIKEYAQSMINSIVSSEDMFDGTEQTGVYVVEDGKLYMALNNDLLELKENYFEYELEGRKLTLVACYGSPLYFKEISEFNIFPWTFTK